MMRIKIFIAVIIYYIIAAMCIPQSSNAQTYNWSPLIFNGNNGTDGEIYSAVYYNNNIVIAGGFNHACGVSARNIAMWHDSVWAPIGTGIGPLAGDTVYTVTV